MASEIYHYRIKCSKWNHPGCRYQYAADNDAEKDMWMYLVGGFVFAAYLGLPVLGVSLIGIVFAGIHDYNYVQRKKLETSNTMELEGGIDL